MGRWALACMVVMAVACTHRHIEPLDLLPFAFEARSSRGEIWVMPPLAVHAPVQINEQHMLGAALPLRQRRIRAERTAELAALPTTIAEVLPGEVNARLGATWQGQFRHSPAPPSHAHRLTDAVLHRRPDLHAVLEGYAEGNGRWVLLTWVSELSGDPLIRSALPGEVVQTSSGPVVVDFEDDPHLISVKLGMALLAPDGEVVLRYEDRFEAVLSGRSARQEAARQLARALADEIALVWMTEAHLAGRP